VDLLIGELDHRLKLETYLSKGIADPSALSSREKAAVQIIAEGMTNKQIADILSISTKTVETHRAAAMGKLALDTTAALIRYAIRKKLVEA
jgi:DNA-binding NarL/FixJ family response regulator